MQKVREKLFGMKYDNNCCQEKHKPLTKSSINTCTPFEKVTAEIIIILFLDSLCVFGFPALYISELIIRLRWNAVIVRLISMNSNRINDPRPLL